MDKKEETSCRRSAVSRLLDFAGPRKALTYLGCTLSAISMVVGFGPYVCIWLVGAWVFRRVYPAVLCRTHVHASGSVPLRGEHAQEGD